MPWASFLFAYVLGGLTLIPLVLLAGLLHAHLTLPYYKTGRPDGGNSDVDTDDDLIQPGDDVSLLQTEKRAHEAAAAAASGSASSARRTNEDDMASGYFAVCREYTPMGINAKPIERTTPVGSTTVAAPSQSVYQTMYKSLFERKTTPKESDPGTSSSWSRKTGNIFFIVLRHGHLMLFDDEGQLEVRHVISLAHHEISIYSGGGVTPEGELYIKKNAICLSRRKDSADLVAADAQPTKPFYLFSENCSAKEDFYFSLLRNQEHTFRDASKDMPPPPQQFEVKDVISLVQKLHSSEDHLQTRWLNAFLGRIFLGIYKTEDIQDYIRGLLMKKISRVKVPSFLTNIAIRKIDTGQGPPFITNPKLREMTVDGEFLAETDIKYTGNFRMEVAATARLDLGARFKAREVDLMLSVTVKRIEGHMLLRVKPPPSNRLWFSFAQLPKMEMVVEPIVSSRQITYTVILRQIENRIKEVVAESLVQPFWDDVPFFRTEDKKWRGGVFEGNEFVAAGGTETQETDIKTDAKADVKADIEDDTPLPDIALKTEVIPTMEKSHSFANSENTTIHKRKTWTEPGADGNGLETAASSSVDFKQTASSLSISPQASNENLVAALQTPPKPSTPHKTLSTQTPSSYKSPTDRTQQHLESQQNTPSRPSQAVDFSQSSSSQSPAQSKSLSTTPAKNDNSEALSDTEVDRASPTRFNLSANSTLATKAAVSSKMTPPVFPEEIELETEATPYGGRRGTVSSMDSDGNSSTSGLKIGRANTVNSVKSQAGSFLSKTAAFLANSSGSSIGSANGNNVRTSRSNSAHDNYSRNNNSSVSLESTPAGASNDGNDNESSGVDSNNGNSAAPVSAVPFRASRPDSRYSYNGKTGSISELPEASLPSTSFLDRENSPTPNITKRNTLAAMSSAAAYARNWGINALARRKESTSSTTATAASDSPAIDLSQPMGRGQPLPPIGTPLPPPEKGNRVTSLPVMKRHSLATPLSTPAISQSTPSAGTITAQSSLPASTTINTQSPISRIPSPLPLRRSPSTASVSSISVAASLSRASSRQSLRQASPIQRKAIEQGSLLPTGDPSLLVVAAPDDFSEPGTPREDEASRDDEWTGTGTGGGFSPVVRSMSRRSYRRSSYGVFQPPGSASSSSSALGLKRSPSRLSNGQRDDDYAASWLDDKS